MEDRLAGAAGRGRSSISVGAVPVDHFLSVRGTLVEGTLAGTAACPDSTWLAAAGVLNAPEFRSVTGLVDAAHVKMSCVDFITALSLGADLVGCRVQGMRFGKGVGVGVGDAVLLGSAALMHAGDSDARWIIFDCGGGGQLHALPCNVSAGWVGLLWETPAPRHCCGCDCQLDGRVLLCSKQAAAFNTTAISFLPFPRSTPPDYACLAAHPQPLPPDRLRHAWRF